MSLAATRTLAKLYDLGPTSISDLAISERSSQPTISNHVQRLETLGLVARKHSDTDARVWLITVTDRGLQELTAMRDQIGANIAPLLAELSESDRQAIRDGLDAIRRLLNGGS
nr:MarR family transcriptional regulator [Microlunatus panaciterrae]